MAHNLTNREIEKLASRRGARRLAVENFLGTADPTIRLGNHLTNLDMDTRLYRWNSTTKRAITAGIKKMYKD